MPRWTAAGSARTLGPSFRDRQTAFPRQRPGPTAAVRHRDRGAADPSGPRPTTFTTRHSPAGCMGRRAFGRALDPQRTPRPVRKVRDVQPVRCLLRLPARGPRSPGCVGTRCPGRGRPGCRARNGPRPDRACRPVRRRSPSPSNAIAMIRSS